MQQRMRLGHIRHVRGSREHRMHEARIGIDADRQTSFGRFLPVARGSNGSALFDPNKTATVGFSVDKLPGGDLSARSRAYWSENHQNSCLRL